MLRSFSHTLLITCMMLFASCTNQHYFSSSEGKNHLVTDTTMAIDSGLVELILPYKLKLEENITRVIAVSNEEMIKGRPESKLTNFLGDLLLEEGRIFFKKSHTEITPDISFFNYGGIRTFLPKGEITVGKIFELMPFENEMVFLQLSGVQIQEFLNRIAANGGESLGGTRFTISDNQAKEIKIGNNDLIPEKDYWLVTNDYVATGGDGLTILTQSKSIIKSNILIRDAIISYLEREYGSEKKIQGVLDERIRFKDKNRSN